MTLISRLRKYRLAGLCARWCVVALLLGMCVQVHDGDTISVLVNNKLTRIRVASIDSPELGQAFGEEAKAFMKSLCYRRQVMLAPLEIDHYGRLVARVYLPDGRNAGREMVANGYAWYFGRYHADENFKNLELKARSGRLGLWIAPKPMPPWLWRQSHPSPRGDRPNLERQTPRI